MPQLDQLLLVSQAKVFLFCFLVTYLVFVFFVLPRLNKVLRVRRRGVSFLTSSFSNLKFFRFRRLFFYKNFLFWITNSSSFIFLKFFRIISFLNIKLSNFGTYLFKSHLV